MRIPARPTIRADPLRRRRRRLIRADRVRAHAALVAVVPNAAFTMRLLRHVRTRQLGDQPAGPHHQHPVGQAEDLLDLVRDEQDRHPVRGEADQHVVDVALRPDVDAAGRLVGDEHARAR